MPKKSSMRPMRVGDLALVFAICLVAFFLLANAANELWPRVLPWPIAAFFLVITIVLVSFGWPVHQYMDGKRPHINRLWAVRVLVLARVCSLVGALFTGAYIASTIALYARSADDVFRQHLALNLTAVASALILAAAGLVVERWCKIPPADSEKGESAA